MITGLHNISVAILGLYYQPWQSVSSTNVDEADAARIALHLWQTTAANKEQ